MEILLVIVVGLMLIGIISFIVNLIKQIFVIAFEVFEILFRLIFLLIYYTYKYVLSLLTCYFGYLYFETTGLVIAGSISALFLLFSLLNYLKFKKSIISIFKRYEMCTKSDLIFRLDNKYSDFKIDRFLKYLEWTSKLSIINFKGKESVYKWNEAIVYSEGVTRNYMKID